MYTYLYIFISTHETRIFRLSAVIDEILKVSAFARPVAFLLLFLILSSLWIPRVQTSAIRELSAVS